MYLVKDKEDDYMIDKAKCIDIYLKQQEKRLKSYYFPSSATKTSYYLIGKTCFL